MAYGDGVHGARRTRVLAVRVLAVGALLFTVFGWVGAEQPADALPVDPVGAPAWPSISVSDVSVVEGTMSNRHRDVERLRNREQAVGGQIKVLACQ